MNNKIMYEMCQLNGSELQASDSESGSRRSG